MKNSLIIAFGVALLITAGCASTQPAPEPTPTPDPTPVVPLPPPTPPTPPTSPDTNSQASARISARASGARLSPTPLASVSVSWSASPSIVTSSGGYNLYLGTNTGVYYASFNTGSNLTYSVSNLVRGVTYYFAATAWMPVGIVNGGTATNIVESQFSNEASYQPSLIPGPPGNLNLVVVAMTGSGATGPWYVRSVRPALNVGNTGYFRLAASSNEVMTQWAATVQGPWQTFLDGPLYDQPMGYCRLDLRPAN